MSFKLYSNFNPSGDQPSAIHELVQGLNNYEKNQILLGVTGSGKTFTMANVIAQSQRPTLILTHNKTLVAQLYGEFKQFFPENAVEYFVSYYDYYQPEAYIVTSDTYIEKDLSINQEIEKLRLSTTASLLSGRRDIIVVASVSCIYGMGNPTEYYNRILRFSVGDQIERNIFLRKLVDGQYVRSSIEFDRATFRVKGDVVDINLPYVDHGLRITFWGNEIEGIEEFEISSGKKNQSVQSSVVFPANMYVAPKDQLQNIIVEIQDELMEQFEYFKSINKPLEAQRIKERVEHDIEMIKELGYCSGIENYSRFLDRRKPGTRPFCLLDYFPKDFVLFIDESHVTVPQIGAMYGGDRSRKLNLVEYGFRLPSAIDNRPLNFNEFESVIGQSVFVSATPGKYELEKCDGMFVEQVVRPTGLLDPVIEIRPSLNQIDDLLEEIHIRISKNERTLITTLTKKMSEELSKYLQNINIKTAYLHSEIDTLERVEILRNLRLGNIDVLVGVNLLREGLDLPEVSLVAIMDADKEGFLRDERSLTQISGRAARNANGTVIFYADRITGSMQRTIEETNRRREKQIEYNLKWGIEPKTILKSHEEIIKQTSVLDFVYKNKDKEESNNLAAEASESYGGNTNDLKKAAEEAKANMNKAARNQDFMDAAYWRDIMLDLEKKIKNK